MKDFLNDLNETQQKAVKDIDGPCLVIAGPGAGKTRVLTYRIAYLLSLGIKANSILALTFTNKAANEMKERIARLVGDQGARNLWMGTFHSIFARILRYESEKLGYPSNYTIYDTVDSKSLLKSIIKDLNLNDQIYKAGEVLNRISFAKNNLITARAYASNNQLIERDKSAGKPELSDIYASYAKSCYKAGAMDFDDLLLNTNILFRDFKDILNQYIKLFQYILVDEYQDTNFAQYLIVNKLSAEHKNICVVGDDSQSIYSFRGAKIENILNFRNDYPEYKLYKLERNYRSTKTIVGAANSIIEKNKNQIHKKVWSKKETGDKIKVIKVKTDNEEGFVVSNKILEARSAKNLNYEDFAILYRTNAQSRIFEEALRRNNIPYKIYGSISFYQRKEIKDLLGYFRLTINQKDDEALKRIINYPARGIGKITVSKLADISNSSEVSLWEVITNQEKYKVNFNQGTKRKIDGFIAMIKDFVSKLFTFEAYDLALLIASSAGILKDFQNASSREEISKKENLQELLNGIKEFSVSQDNEENIICLDKFMENVSLLTDTDNENAEDKDKVVIMTMHSAKGLEFNTVYLAGVEEELFPSRLTASSAEELEEERRLFYVAITRAKNEVYITYTQSRYKWGNLINCVPSRFIRDIDVKYIELPIENEAGQPSDQENNISTGYQGGHNYNYRRKKLSVTPSSYNKNLISLDKANKKTISKDISGIINQGVNQKRSTEPISNKPGDFKFDDPAKIQAGMNVEHSRFGSGKVLNLEGSPPNVKATVFFKNYGQKQLLLKFAKLKIIK